MPDSPHQPIAAEVSQLLATLGVASDALQGGTLVLGEL